MSGYFTKEEDDALTKLVEVDKLDSWFHIANKMPNRNEYQVIKRWKQLMAYV